MAGKSTPSPKFTDSPIKFVWETQSDEPSDLPCLPLRISDSLTLVALIDTGAETSYVNSDTFERVTDVIGHRIDFDPVFGTAGSKGVDLHSRIFGRAYIEGTIFGAKIESAFYILVDETSVDYDLIIGVDILKDIKAVFYFGSWSLGSPLFEKPIKFLTATQRETLMKLKPKN